MSHNLAVMSSLAVTNQRPSAVNSTARMIAVWPRRTTGVSVELCRSQRRVVPSGLPVASQRASGLNAAGPMRCPCRVRFVVSLAPAPRSQSVGVRLVTVINQRLFGLNAATPLPRASTTRTAFDEAWAGRCHNSKLRSHTVVTVTIHRPSGLTRISRLWVKFANGTNLPRPTTRNGAEVSFEWRSQTRTLSILAVNSQRLFPRKMTCETGPECPLKVLAEASRSRAVRSQRRAALSCPRQAIGCRG
jgi:hypothetical protein